MSALSRDQIEAYERDGFIVVKEVLSAGEVAELRRVTDELVEKARFVREHDAVYDLEDSHSAQEPRVRRIKTPACPGADLRPGHAAPEGAGDPAGAARPGDPLRHLQAQHEGRRLRCRRRVAPGLGVLPAHQRRPLRGRRDDGRLRHRERAADVRARQPQGPVYDHHADGVFCGAIDPSAPTSTSPRRCPASARPAASPSTTPARSTARR